MNVLSEVSRKNLVGKTKVHSPARYNKRLRYSTMSVPEINEDEFINEDKLSINVRVGQYVDTLSYEGVMSRIIKLVSQDPRHRLTRRIVVRAMNEQVDLTDVYVNCTCPDFKYRYAVWATKYDYKYGAPENRPADITNPNDTIGATCKHLACILSNKKWLVKAASVVNEVIHTHLEEIIQKYNIDETVFIVDELKYQAAVIGAVKRELRRPPADVVGATSKLFSEDELEDRLFNLLDRRGWLLRIDTDLDKPVMVYISKSAEALDNPEESDDIVYVYDVKPAGNKIRLQQIKE